MDLSQIFDLNIDLKNKSLQEAIQIYNENLNNIFYKDTLIPIFIKRNQITEKIFKTDSFLNREDSFGISMNNVIINFLINFFKNDKSNQRT